VRVRTASGEETFIDAHHRDRLDRLLIAPAGLEHVPVMTWDSVFGGHGIDVISARL
jgi:PIN domain nuclease of toxin-antitoxin system